MKKKLFISLALAVAIGIASIGILYPHGLGYYDEEDVKVKVKKVDKGIQLTITSDDPEIARDIQREAKWYREFFALREQDPYRNDYGHHRGMMGSHGGM